MPEYGWKATSDSPLTGLTRNPWDTRMTTGGSSAGAVAASVLGMGALQLGTDGGGSIRIPAAFTGCFGLKPTRARVPAFPASPLGTLAHIGPLTRTVADAALAMSVISAPDARDVYAWISPAPDFTSGLDDGVRGLRIAYSPRLGYRQARPSRGGARRRRGGEDIREPRRHRRAGRPRPGRRPDRRLEHALVAVDALSAAGLRRPLARAGRSRACGRRRRRAAQYRWSTTSARSSSARELHNVFARFHETFDLLLTPTLPLPAFEVGDLVPRSGEWGTAWSDWSPFSYPFNLTHPAGGFGALRA